MEELSDFPERELGFETRRVTPKSVFLLTIFFCLIILLQHISLIIISGSSWSGNSVEMSVLF